MTDYSVALNPTTSVLVREEKAQSRRGNGSGNECDGAQSPELLKPEWRRQGPPRASGGSTPCQRLDSPSGLRTERAHYCFQPPSESTRDDRPRKRIHSLRKVQKTALGAPRHGHFQQEGFSKWTPICPGRVAQLLEPRPDTLCDLCSGHVQESTSERMKKWNNGPAGAAQWWSADPCTMRSPV